jgi:dolichol-phosphate mannosyltransferase
VTIIAGIVLLLQAVLAVRVLARLVRTADGDRIHADDRPRDARVAIVVPVLDERERIGACLAALAAQSDEVREILVVDGGSQDGTQAVTTAHAAADLRIRLVDASPVPADATGKAWGLSVGLRRTSPGTEWILCVDADVRAAPGLTRALIAHAERTGVPAFSVATRQRLSGAGEALIHPSLLATLVYRFGSPGHATADPSAVQANGQCFLARRDLLLATGAVEAARTSLCEDVTIARALAAGGHRVGFYEADGLATVGMYGSGREAWRNWPRSLPMRDGFFGWREALGLLEVVFVQALPGPLLVLTAALGGSRAAIGLEVMLVACRLGVLAGMARAYVDRPLAYWLSPLTDVPVAVRLMTSALRRRHRWRGWSYVRRPHGWVRVEEGS